MDIGSQKEGKDETIVEQEQDSSSPQIPLKQEQVKPQSRIDNNTASGEGQDEPKGVVIDSSSSKKEEDSTTMDDEKVKDSQPSLDDEDNSEFDGDKTKTGTRVSSGTGTAGGDDEEDEGINILPLTGLTIMRSEDVGNGVGVQEKSEGKSNKDKIIIMSSDEDEDEDDRAADEDAENLAPEKEKGGNMEEKNDACKGKKKKKKAYERPTKIMLRFLPPKIKKAEFLAAVSPLPDHDYVFVHNPDPEWGPNAGSVAYINFLDPDDALWFIERFSGYEFLDENGEPHEAIGDYAMIQKVFRPRGKFQTNPHRGKLNETEKYQTFLRLYEEDPFQFDIGLRPPQILTAEEMMAEIESRPKRTGTEPTPLTEFVLNKTVRKEAERKARREKEKERKKLEKEKRAKEREAERQKRKKEKREKREKEQKEKREKERLERQAGTGKAQGTNITFSKSGKVTRWSANSGPNARKTKEESEVKVDEVKPNDKDQGSTPALDTSKTKPVKHLGDSKKTHPSNPFSKDAKKPEKPREDKRFTKPFPVKSIEAKHKVEARKYQDAEKQSTSKPPKESSETAKASQSASVEEKQLEDNGNGESKGKKKIIKKIIRIKKVKKGGEDGDVVETKIVSETVMFSSKSDKNNGGSKKSDLDDGLPKPTAENTSRTESVKLSKDEATSKPNDNPEDAKKRRVRPEMQIYKPKGGLRNSAKYSRPEKKDDDSTSAQSSMPNVSAPESQS